MHRLTRDPVPVSNLCHRHTITNNLQHRRMTLFHHSQHHQHNRPPPRETTGNKHPSQRRDPNKWRTATNSPTVTHQPDQVSPTNRTRVTHQPEPVPKVSPTYRNHTVKHEPEQHTSVQQPSMDVRSIEAKSHRLELRCEARNPPALAGVAGFRVAERVGFEPTVPLRGHLLSREAQSAVLCHLSRVLDSVAARLVLRVGFGARFRTARRLLALALSGFSSTPVQP